MICSDGWGGYSGLSALGYNHQVVIHSRHFVSPDDEEVHTQSIESLWGRVRQVKKKIGRMQFDEDKNTPIGELLFHTLYMGD